MLKGARLACGGFWPLTLLFNIRANKTASGSQRRVLLYVMFSVSSTINCDPNNVTTQIVEKKASVTFNWAKATTVEIEKYRTLTSEVLKYIELLPAITCDDCNCTSAEQKLQIDQFYMQLCTVLEKASRDSIPSFRSTVNSSRDYIIPGFTEHVKDLHTIARGGLEVNRVLDQYILP